MPIFAKTFLYTLTVMLAITTVAHTLPYLLAPRLTITYPQSDGGMLLAGDVNTAAMVAQALRAALPVSFACCVALSLAAAYLFSRMLTVPMRDLSHAVADMAALDRSARCPVRSHDEIGDMAARVNELYVRLLDTIDRLEAEQRRALEREHEKLEFLRAASHELKTPVTAINVMLENMMLGVGRYRDHDAYLPQCKRMAERLSAMICDLLEASRPRVVRDGAAVPVRLGARMDAWCEPYRLIAAARGLRFALRIPATCTPCVDPGELGTAVGAILANAVAYTPPGGLVDVAVTDGELRIANECEPISRDDVPRLFEPFQRFGGNGRDDGNGLGLYIAATSLAALGLRYEFAPCDRPRGMCFTIRLPH